MKPFDQVLFDENDRVAKEAVRDFIKYQWSLAAPVVKVDNRYMADEPFFDVPVAKWKTVELLPF